MRKSPSRGDYVESGIKRFAISLRTKITTISLLAVLLTACASTPTPVAPYATPYYPTRYSEGCGIVVGIESRDTLTFWVDANYNRYLIKADIIVGDLTTNKHVCWRVVDGIIVAEVK